MFNKILRFQGFKKIDKINIKKGFEKSYINKKFAKLRFLNFNNLNKLNTEFFLYNLAIPKKLRIKFEVKPSLSRIPIKTAPRIKLQI